MGRAPQLTRKPLSVHEVERTLVIPSPQDPAPPSAQRLRAEYRRVGVSDLELSNILRLRLEAFVRNHPDVQNELAQDPAHSPEGITHVFSCEIALDALAGLADGSGTAVYLERLEKLEKERGWALPGWSGPPSLL